MDTITVSSTPAVVETNFIALKKQLAQELLDYDVVVTLDTVKDAKSKATELNKLSGEIDTRRKEEVKKVSEPIKAFETQAKELTTMCQDVRTRILDQVKVFESAALVIVAKKLVTYRDELYTKHEVRSEFQHADVTGLEKLSWLTTKGNLTSAALKTVDELVSQCTIRQRTTDLRLSQLENESHRAGLHSPLVREHVEGILFSPDKQYEEGLKKLVAREVERQEETERIATKKAELVAEEKLKREQAAIKAAEDKAAEAEPVSVTDAPELAETFPIIETETPVQEQAPQTEAPAQPAGKKTIQVDLVLHVLVGQYVSAEKVREMLLEQLKAARIDQSISSCRAHEVSQPITEAA